MSFVSAKEAVGLVVMLSVALRYRENIERGEGRGESFFF